MRKRIGALLAGVVLLSGCGAGVISTVGETRDTGDPKYVALTFDDGPSPRCTPRLLDGLQELGARATFFVVGCQVVKDPDIVQRMAAAFPGGVLVFDAANEKAVRLMLKTWIRDAKIKDVGAYFAVADAKAELGPWDSRLQISSRGYMLGYHDLKDPSVSGFFRVLARVGDRSMNMQIVRIGFGGEI